MMPLVYNGFVMNEIRKGMYGFPQAEILANNRLQKHLHEHGYVAVPHTPGLFKHVTQSILFTLVVNDFGIKYINTYDWE